MGHKYIRTYIHTNKQRLHVVHFCLPHSIYVITSRQFNNMCCNWNSKYCFKYSELFICILLYYLKVLSCTLLNPSNNPVKYVFKQKRKLRFRISMRIKYVHSPCKTDSRTRSVQSQTLGFPPISSLTTNIYWMLTRQQVRKLPHKHMQCLTICFQSLEAKISFTLMFLPTWFPLNAHK